MIYQRGNKRDLGLRFLQLAIASQELAFVVSSLKLTLPFINAILELQ
jgi:hypothetical protein